MNEQNLTPQQRAGHTLHERKEREKAAREQARLDRERAITVCREIRDNPACTDAERLGAIKLLDRLTRKA